jgi:hypothetical protein
MAVSNGLNPTFDGLFTRAVTLTPAATPSSVNTIPAGVHNVRLAANVNDVNDFTVLPSLASVPNGFEITIIAGAANSELRTPAASAEEINSEDCDGTKEALLTATNVYKVIKNDNTIGWTLIGFTAIGAYQAAIVPDA